MPMGHGAMAGMASRSTDHSLSAADRGAGTAWLTPVDLVLLVLLTLFWGVTRLANAPVHDGPQLRAFIDQWGRDRGLLAIGDRVVFVTGTNFYPMAQNIVVIHEVE